MKRLLSASTHLRLLFRLPRSALRGTEAQQFHLVAYRPSLATRHHVGVQVCDETLCVCDHRTTTCVLD